MVLEKHRLSAGKIKQTKSAWYKEKANTILRAQRKHYTLQSDNKKEAARERYAS